MPNIEAAIKRVRTSEKSAVQNNVQKSSMRTAIKKYAQSIEAGNENSEQLLKEAIKAIDMAASKGLIHKNKANRDKSRLTAKLAK
ncbi:30S ribosomal protein S20 [Carnobacterium viridans]|uniref:Small ribosomal subunit protein bS20 n=1 Tax=Carnobacterium viridans TaxID=174587 RepID=A0A1H0XR62_9LACT|nr:30S ribosomal protein S20 [Carnobacterium viridans]UDE95591.1 30S ribosomal protein S20 [Carnobacterium viridans]SDQ05394.1 small subunit ribosomal protein S20 [Carnobacterium viridans]